MDHLSLFHCEASQTPLAILLVNMVSKNPQKLAQMILDDTHHVNQPDDDGCRPLNRAVIENRRAQVEVLLKFGAEVDHPSGCFYSDQHTPLFLAVANGNLEIAKLLLDAGASIDKHSSKRTPLFLAVQMRNLKMIELLLRYHANPLAVCCLQVGRTVGDDGEILNDGGYFESPLHFALKSGRIEESSLLLEAELHNLVSVFNFCQPEEVHIHQNTAKMMKIYLKQFASTASNENPLGKMRMEKGEEPIINKRIRPYNWTPQIKAEVGTWGFSDWTVEISSALCFTTSSGNAPLDKGYTR